MANLMNEVERLARDTGAAVAFGAHFAKGNAAGKESIDRISGSGVFARDPDSILTLTKHTEADAFTVDATLRNFKPLDPFVVRWQFPLMRRDDGLDPTALKQPHKSGRPPKYNVEMILKHLVKPQTNADWCKVSMDKDGMAKQTFYDLRRELEAAKRIELTPKDKWKRASPKSPKTTS